MLNIHESFAEDESNLVFTCRTANSKTLTNVLLRLGGSYSMRKDQRCSVEVTNESISFLVRGKSKSTEGRASLQSALFDDYYCSCTTTINFSLNLTTVLDCLLLFGTSSDSTAIDITYNTSDATFKLSLEDSGVLTICDIFTLADDDDDLYGEYDATNISSVTTPNDGPSISNAKGQDVRPSGLLEYFRQYPELCQLILKSEILRETLQELGDVSGTSGTGFISVTVIKESGLLQLSISGVVDSCDIEYPSSSPAFVYFRANVDTLSFSYPLSAFQIGMKAADIAKETYIRINEIGIMCIQHQIETAEGKETYMDFLLLSGAE